MHISYSCSEFFSLFFFAACLCGAVSLQIWSLHTIYSMYLIGLKCVHKPKPPLLGFVVQHVVDLLWMSWICCTFVMNAVDLLWTYCRFAVESTTNLRHLDMSGCRGFVVQLIVQQIHVVEFGLKLWANWKVEEKMAIKFNLSLIWHVVPQVTTCDLKDYCKIFLKDYSTSAWTVSWMTGRHSSLYRSSHQQSPGRY